MGDTGAGYDVLLHKTQQSSSARSKSPSPKAGTSQRMAPGADTLPFDGDRPTVTFSALSTDPASQASGEPESAGEAASPRQQEKKAPSPKRAPSAQQAHRKGLLGKQTGARKRAALTLAPEKFRWAVLASHSSSLLRGHGVDDDPYWASTGPYCTPAASSRRARTCARVGRRP